MKCSFCGSTDETRTLVQGIGDTYICNVCIALMYEMIIVRGIKNKDDLTSLNESDTMKNEVNNDFNFEALNSDTLNVKFVEFFRLGNSPDQDKGDWGDEFAIWLYFIDNGSVKIYNDQIFEYNGKVYFSAESFIDALDEQLSGKIIFNGEPLPGRVLQGLIQTAVSGDNDVEVVYEFFQDNDVEIIQGVDDVSSDYAGKFGCRVWEFDVDGGRVNASNSSYELDFSNCEYEDSAEYANMREDDVRKSIAIVMADFD